MFNLFFYNLAIKNDIFNWHKLIKMIINIYGTDINLKI